ncbi:MAG: hypothetical protein H0W14_04025 [Actinobacteria bacterium]|nr:hypothetical protein [Actinomycetota bacterium]
MPWLRPLAPALVLFVLTGCGGDDEPAPPPDVRSQPVEYRGAYAICSIGSVRYVAERYGVPEATPEAVADAAAKAVGSTSPKSAEFARRGCLDAIAARAPRRPGNEAP